jgi:hypothetical protein
MSDLVLRVQLKDKHVVDLIFLERLDYIARGCEGKDDHKEEPEGVHRGE